MKKIMGSVSFLFVASILFHRYFFIHNVPLVSLGTDATTQLVMYRAMLANEWNHGNYFWSWVYGLGGDLFAQFNYYYSNSIFFILSLFFESATMEDIVAAHVPMSIIKIFIAMVGLYSFLRYEKRSHTASILGALFYGGSVTFALYMHIFDFMTDAFVLLPFVIWALAHFIRTNKGNLFIITMAIVLVTNFYFAFILTLYIAMFALYRYAEQAERSWQHFFLYTWRIAWRYSVAVGVAAFSFLPAVMQFLQSDRLAKEYDIPFFFQAEFYWKIPKLLMMSHHSTYSVGVAMFAFILLITSVSLKGRSNRAKQLFAVGMILFFGLPIMYSMFNGFSAMQNRWYFLLAFTVSYVAASQFDDVLKEKRAAKTVLCTYIVLAFYLMTRLPLRPDESIHFDSILLVCGAVATLSFFAAIYYNKLRPIFFALLIGTTLYASVIQYDAYFTYAYQEANREVVDAFFDKVAYGGEEGLHIANQIKREQSPFGRVIFDSPQYELNSGMYYNLKTHSAYQSLIPKNVHQFFKEHYNIKQIGTSSLYHNYDNRLYLETAMGNEFYVSEMKTWYVPYGYDTFFYTPNWHVLKNNHTLPIGYAYPANAWMDEDTFAQLTTVEKDQAFMQALVVKDETLQQIPSSFRKETLKTTLLASGLDNVTFVNMQQVGLNEYVTQKEGSYMEMAYTRPKEAGEIVVEVDIKTTIDKQFTMKISDKEMLQYAPSWSWSYPKTTFTFNLGTLYEQSPLKIHLTRNRYKISDVRIYFNSYAPYKDMVAARQQQSLQHVTYDGGFVKGDINVQEASLMFLSIPYSKGWTLTVDGQQQNIYEVQHSFIGFPLEKGTHTIELHYMTPYVKIGAIISILTLLFVVLCSLRNRLKMKGHDLQK